MFNRIHGDDATLHTFLPMMIRSKNHFNKFANRNEMLPVVRCFAKNFAFMIREKMFYMKPNSNDKGTNAPHIWFFPLWEYIWIQ